MITDSLTNAIGELLKGVGLDKNFCLYRPADSHLCAKEKFTLSMAKEFEFSDRNTSQTAFLAMVGDWVRDEILNSPYVLMKLEEKSKCIVKLTEAIAKQKEEKEELMKYKNYYELALKMNGVENGK